jgi:hypothetical protein
MRKFSPRLRAARMECTDFACTRLHAEILKWCARIPHAGRMQALHACRYFLRLHAARMRRPSKRSLPGVRRHAACMHVCMPIFSKS